MFSLFNLERNSKRNSKLNGVAIAVIVKNEAPYIKEWVEYYKIIGITKIYLYDNDSQDDLKDRIKTDVESGYVKGGFELSFYGGLKMHDLGGLRINRC